MRNSTSTNQLVQQTRTAVRKVIRIGETMHANSDSLFFVRMFARACNSPVALA